MIISDLFMNKMNSLVEEKSIIKVEEKQNVLDDTSVLLSNFEVQIESRKELIQLSPEPSIPSTTKEEVAIKTETDKSN